MNFDFLEISHLKMPKISKNSICRAEQMVKMAVFEASKWPELVSRKIHVSKKVWSFHTVCTMMKIFLYLEHSTNKINSFLFQSLVFRQWNTFWNHHLKIVQKIGKSVWNWKANENSQRSSNRAYQANTIINQVFFMNGCHFRSWIRVPECYRIRLFLVGNSSWILRDSTIGFATIPFSWSDIIQQVKEGM